MASRRTKCLIIGAGPAGYTAAVYAARANLEPVVLQGLQPGGQLTITSDVENWPGDTTVLGPALMERMAAQAEHAGARLVFDVAVDVDFSSRPFRCVTDGGDEYVADTVIVATGAQAKWLGLASEMLFRGQGVSGCAVCDGAFFRGKVVAVVGGGNTAVEDALYLTRHAAKVVLLHRRDSLKAERVLQDRLFANPKVEVHWHSAIDEVLGSGTPAKVTGLRIRDVRDDTRRVLDVDGLFVAIGHAPATDLFRGHLPMDPDGYLRVRPGTATTEVPGVFAAGDVSDRTYRQAVVAAGSGCMAALEAERFLAEHPVQVSSVAALEPA